MCGLDRIRTRIEQHLGNLGMPSLYDRAKTKVPSGIRHDDALRHRDR